VTSTAAPTVKNVSRKCRVGWIGVDIGTSALKFAQVAYERGQWSLAASLIVPVERPGHIGLSPSVCSLVSDSVAFRGKLAAIALPLSMAELRTMELPPGSDDEIRAMVAQELTTSDGFSADQREFDFWELETPQQDEGTRTYAVLSVSRELAHNAANDLLKAGLKCEALDGVPFALARAIDMSGPTNRTDVVAALDWGFTSVTFVVVAGGEPIFVRSLRDCDLGLIVDRMSKELGLTPTECRRLLVNYGLPHADGGHPASGLQEAIGDVVAEPLACLVAELTKTMSFAGRQLRKRAPQSLLLLGGGATIRNVAEHLSSRLQLPVSNWSLPRQTGYAAALGEDQTALFGVAAGLSQLGVSR